MHTSWSEIFSHRRWCWQTVGFLLILLLSVPAQGHAQSGFTLTRYTSQDGLPQNSIRGMAFDEHGFLWMVTEGGVSRFDGRSFRNFGEADFPSHGGRRFSHLLFTEDSTMLFVDQLNGVCGRKGDRLTLQQFSEKDILKPGIPRIHGVGFPKEALLSDSLVRQALNRAYFFKTQTHAGLFLGDKDHVLVVGENIVNIDRRRRRVDTLATGEFDGAATCLLGTRLLWLDAKGSLQQLETGKSGFTPVRVVDERGNPWAETFRLARFFAIDARADPFLLDARRLYRLSWDATRNAVVVRVMLDEVPQSTRIISLAWREATQMLFLGSESHGLFSYRRAPLRSYLFGQSRTAEIYYAQALLDSTLLVASEGQLIDLRTHCLAGRLPVRSVYKYQIAKTDNEALYCLDAYHGYRLMKCTSGEVSCRMINDSLQVKTLLAAGQQLFLATEKSVGRLAGERIKWYYHYPFSYNRDISQMRFGPDGRLWMASLRQLYRLDTSSLQLDSIPLFTNAGARTLERIGDKMFIGTYGRGYFVWHKDKWIPMPLGPGDLLAHVHAIVPDPAGYLWMTTNHGLIRTHLSAIETFLADSTRMPPLYLYREEDGIRNAEFNGGCSPSYCWLPDGRLSFPSLEGLVIFDPMSIGPAYDRDSVVIERIDVDGVAYPPESLPVIAARHTTISVYFATAWWAQPVNLQLDYTLDGPDSRFIALPPDQQQCILGHLEPGQHTLIIRKRSGFGPNDFLYTRISFYVAAPWYQTTLAMLLYAASLLGFIWGFSSLRAQSVSRRNKHLAQVVEEKTTALREVNMRLAENVDRLARSETDLRRNIRVRDRLMSIITHDILTPLRFISLVAKLGGKPKAEGAVEEPVQVLAEVQNAVGKLYHSTQNMLHWVKYNQDGFRPQITPCAPFVIVDQLVSEFSEMSLFQGNEIVNEVPEDDLIRTDPQLLLVILHNLLSNAIKFTIRGRIVIRSSVQAGGYWLYVSDTGRGMTEDQLRAVRKGAVNPAYSTVDEFAAGTGIGLSLVAELVDVLGGGWTIESPGGQGVVVSISLPRAGIGAERM